MTLKYQVDTLEGIDDTVKPLYQEKDGKFVLRVEGIPQPPSDYDTLKESIQKLQTKNQELLDARAQAKRAAEQAALDAANKSGDVEAIKKSLTQTHEEERNRWKEIEAKKDQIIRKKVADAAAWSVAGELGIDEKASKAIHKLIRGMYDVEFVDGDAHAVVIDEKGNKTAMTSEDVKNYALNEFPHLCVGSRSSGGGSLKGSGSVTKKFNEYTSAELVEMRKENPAAYERIKKEFYN